MMVKMYRKKPVAIEAIIWDGTEGTRHKINEWSGSTWNITENQSLIIPTLEGNMTASVGDYIIKGVNGEFYPCKPDIFEKTYESCGNDVSVMSDVKDGSFDFGTAIVALKHGRKVARKGWNGRGIFIELQTPDEHSKMTHPYIFIDTTGLQTDNKFAPKDRVPWLASQTDMLAEDWVMV